MRILMISPSSGGIDTYVESLKSALERAGDNEVMIDGIRQMDGAKQNEALFNYKTNKWMSSSQVKKIAENAARRIKFEKYDLIAFHYGKNDIEQYLPVILSNRRGLVPNSVYFVHYLSRNLFSEYLDDFNTQYQVERQVGNFYDGYVFFGKYAKKFMEHQYKKQFNGIINFLPETHSHEILDRRDSKDLTKRFVHPLVTKYNLPLIVWPGFPAHYKDYFSLLRSLQDLDSSMALLFVGRGWKKYLGFSSKKIGKCFVYCIDKYLQSKEYAFLTRKSLFGILLYRQPNNPKEVFQGSGTLSNFIYEGKAVIVFNEGAMAEYVGDAGIILKDKKLKTITTAIKKMLIPELRMKYERLAINRKTLFDINLHARKCLSFFNKLLI